jgi:hypothetical protein
MSPKAQQIAIAEACGWKWIQTNWESKSGLIGTDSPHSGNIPYEGTNYPSNRHLPTYGKAIPDYLNDLNAMHKAEKILKGGMRSKYDAELTLICSRDYNFIWESTAAQRAEAFLKTIGKWVD